MSASASLFDSALRGPERPGGQGIDRHQEESANVAIHRLLASEEGRAWTDFVATYRYETGLYEAWALRGMVRWLRRYADGGGYAYEVVEVRGENPIGRQDPFALSTLEEELAAGRAPGVPFIEPERLTYPFAYERISQLFDSPDGPDLYVNPKSYAYGRSPGQHGAADVVQSRSPLVFSGPGVRRGRVAIVARQIDIAPTIAKAMGLPLIDGADSTGRTSSERGVPPDVYLRRQDGRPLDEILEPGERPERAYILLLDGQSHSELLYRLASDGNALPNLRLLIERGCLFEHGSTTNLPSITWPSHNAIGTGCWSGHHDIVNPSYYLRDRRETISPQGAQFDTARCLSPAVETLFEAFHRVHGEWDGERGVVTASIIEPCTRGATHATLEYRLLGDKAALKALTLETEHEIGPRWKLELEDHGHRMMGEIDNRGLAQARLLFTDASHPPPIFTFHEFSQPDAAAHDYGPHHEGAREALDETDRRIGHILRTLRERGLFESTLFVVTTDHGMAETDTSLDANPAWIPRRAGMAAIVTEPFIYLRDLRVEVEVAPDGRTARAGVFDNDADTTGEHPPVEGAELLVTDARDGLIARTRTNGAGLAAFPVPGDVAPGELRMSVRAEGFNPRHLRLDGTNLVLDVEQALYGEQG